MRRSAAVLLLLAPLSPASAQTQYRDAEAGTPIRIEDAVPMEKSAIDLSLASLRLERLTGPSYRGLVEPRLSLGVAGRTEVFARAPIAYRTASGGGGEAGLAGLGVGFMRALNIETLRVPSVALSAEAFLPVGNLSAGHPAYSVKGYLTRSLHFLRVHVNASLGTYGINLPVVDPLDTACANPASSGGADAHPLLACAPPPPPPPIDGPCAHVAPPSRFAATPLCSVALATSGPAGDLVNVRHAHWLAGIGIDHSPLVRSMMFQADAFVERYEGIGRPIDGIAEVGMRLQLAPSVVMGAGVGRHFAGFNQSWFLSSGISYTRAGPILARTP